MSVIILIYDFLNSLKNARVIFTRRKCTESFLSNFIQRPTELLSIAALLANSLEFLWHALSLHS